MKMLYVCLIGRGWWVWRRWTRLQEPIDPIAAIKDTAVQLTIARELSQNLRSRGRAQVPNHCGTGTPWTYGGTCRWCDWRVHGNGALLGYGLAACIKHASSITPTPNTLAVVKMSRWRPKSTERKKSRKKKAVTVHRSTLRFRGFRPFIKLFKYIYGMIQAYIIRMVPEHHPSLECM